MSDLKDTDKLQRFIHEIVHEIASEDLKDTWRDMVAIIINKWEEFKERELTNEKTNC